MRNQEEEYNRKNPFTVPDGYFETLDERIMSRVKKEARPSREKWLRVMRPYFGLAGVFVFAMLMVHWVLPQAFPVKEKQEVETVDFFWQTLVEGQDVEFDEDFNPTEEEIIEYLTQEMETSEFYWIAGVM